MSPHPSSPRATATVATATDHHRAVLDDLVDLGHELARFLVAQGRTIAPAPDPPPAPVAPEPDATTLSELADAFDRVTRSVRRSILLGLIPIPGSRTFKRRTPAEIAILHARAADPPAAATAPNSPSSSSPRPPDHDQTEFEINKQFALLLATPKPRR